MWKGCDGEKDEEVGMRQPMLSSGESWRGAYHMVCALFRHPGARM